MNSLLRDLRYAARALARTPLFTFGVVLTLALGIGVNAAMFGVVDTLFLKPPAGVADAGRVVRVYRRNYVSLMHRTFTGELGAYASFQDLRDAGIFERVAAVAGRSMSLGRGSEAQSVNVAAVSHDYFPLLGVGPARGRLFGAPDDRSGGERVAVVSWSYWQRRLGGDSAAIGRPVQLGKDAYTVIGVTAKGFGGIDLTPVDLWLPIEVVAADFVGAEAVTSRDWYWVGAIARLKAGDQATDAASRATTVYRRGMLAAPQHPDEQLSEIRLGPVQEARGPTAGSDATVSAWVAAVALAVLLIACANVANLLLARGVGRRRELAVRAGLGAGRGGLMRLVLAESAVLSAGGGAVALLLAVWVGGSARGLLIPDLPADTPVVDARVLAFTAIAILVTALLTGIVPALQSSRTDLAESLRSGGHGATLRSGRTRAALLAAQVGLTLVLLVGAGLFVRSLRNVEEVDLGFDAARVDMLRVNLGSVGISGDAADATYLRLLERIQQLPSVEYAAATSAPLGWMMMRSMRAEGWDSLPRLSSGGPYQNVVTPDFVATMGARLSSGRMFTATDRAGGPPVAIINEMMARTLWPHQRPLGKCLFLSYGTHGAEGAPCTQVVGVIADARPDVVEDPPMQYYLPWGQAASSINGLYVRARGSAESLVATLQAAVRADGELPHANIQPLEQALAPQLRSWRLGAQAFTAFGALALVIAAMGIFAVISYSVSQRTQEIGVRMALGAEAGQVARMVLGQGLRPAVAGMVLGAGGAYALGRAIRSLLYGVTPTDPLVFAGVTLVLIASAAAAAWLPARRAARVHPMVALRYE